MVAEIHLTLYRIKCTFLLLYEAYLNTLSVLDKQNHQLVATFTSMKLNFLK